MAETPAWNDLSGTVRGAVVQSGSIGTLIINKPAPNVPIPAQLPPLSRSFTNRAAELSLLEQWSAEEGPLVAVISGPGGVGKTMVALRWLHGTRDRFPGGQLYVDLGAFAPSGILEPDQVLEWFLLALGVPPETMPFGLAPRQALYRSLTAARAVAVLLDNADSAAQVRPLLPGSGDSAVAVTSRGHLATLSLDGGRFLTVPPLSEVDSVTLLRTIVGASRLAADGGEATDLARLCGGLPIALALVAGRLAAHPLLAVAREIRNLRSDHRLATLSLDEQSIEGIFALSYNDLPAPVAWVYRSVSLHPGQSFVVEVAAAAAGRPVDDIANSVHELVNRTMLEELDESRFRLHDLQRDYARQQAELTDSENDRNAAIRRMLEWYLNRAVDADLVLRPTRRRVGPLFADEREPGFASHQAALDWLTGEQRNIVLAVHAADEHGWDDLTWQFCEALWGFFLHHRFYSDWLDIHALGIPAAKREGNVLAQAYLRTQLCFALTGLHRYDDATREGRIALDLAVQKNDKATQAMVLGELAGAVQGTGDLHGALSYLHQAKEIRDVIGTDRAVALILRRIGEILDQLGRTEEAVVALRTAADALLDLDRAQHGSTLTRLGAVYLRSGRISDAMPLLTTALSIAREFDSPHYEAAALVVLGDAAWHHNNAAKASDRWTAAHTIYSASGDPKAADVERRLAGITSARADEV